MKILHLFRHAEAALGGTDHDRKLRKNGITETERMLGYLLENGIRADRIVSSTAVRAVRTAGIIAAGLNIEMHTDDRLYESSASGYFEIVQSQPEEAESVMIFAHNGSITNFGNIFLERPIDWLPCSGLISLEFDVEKWSEITRVERPCSQWVICPNDLRHTC